MNNDSPMSRPPPAPAADDDWETADIDTFKPKSQKPSNKPTNAHLAPPILRPSAPAFTPRPPSQPGRPRAQESVAPGPKILSRGTKSPEEEDEWFGASRRPVTNRQIWDSANSASTPPTTIITSSTTLSTTYATQLPPAPVMQILRRPAKDSKRRPGDGSGSGSNTPTNKTLSEREEEYRLARERIFANSASASAAAGSGSGSGVGTGEGVTPGRGEDELVKGLMGMESLSIVPIQVGRGGSSQRGSPVGEEGRRVNSPGRLLASAAGGGVLRQPRGPGGGGGFGGP